MKRIMLLALVCMLGFACNPYTKVDPYDPDVMHSKYLEGKACYEAQDYDRAYAIMKPLALKGHAHAQYYTALMYYQGQGVVPFPHEGALQFFKAAQQGHAEAMYKLALAYDQGAGVMPNPERALYWISKSAETVYMVSLGWNYSVIPANGQAYPITLYWFHVSHEPNDFAMLYDTAQRYRLGAGVEQDLSKAVNMYRYLALQENPYQADAQFELGMMYYSGYGVDKDIVQARGWLQLAAAQGHALAVQELAELNSYFPPSGTEEPFQPEIVPEPVFANIYEGEVFPGPTPGQEVKPVAQPEPVVVPAEPVEVPEPLVVPDEPMVVPDEPVEAPVEPEVVVIENPPVPGPVETEPSAELDDSEYITIEEPPVPYSAPPEPTVEDQPLPGNALHLLNELPVSQTK